MTAALISLCLPAAGQTTTDPGVPRANPSREAPRGGEPRAAPAASREVTGGVAAQGKQAPPPAQPVVQAPTPTAPPNSTAPPAAGPVGGTQPLLVPAPPGVQMPAPQGTQTPAPPADQKKLQKESGWYSGGAYSFNLLNIEYYDFETRDLHYSGQRRDINNRWQGLADLLDRSKAFGFVKVHSKYINMRNVSSIHELGGGAGANLTFRDGATLRVSGEELGRLIEVTQ